MGNYATTNRSNSLPPYVRVPRSHQKNSPEHSTIQTILQHVMDRIETDVAESSQSSEAGCKGFETEHRSSSQLIRADSAKCKFWKHSNDDLGTARDKIRASTCFSMVTQRRGNSLVTNAQCDLSKLADGVYAVHARASGMKTYQMTTFVFPLCGFSLSLFCNYQMTTALASPFHSVVTSMSDSCMSCCEQQGASTGHATRDMLRHERKSQAACALL